MTDSDLAAADFAGLLRRAGAGDAAAFAELYREVQPGLLRYLRLLAGEQAEDVASETWLAVVRGLARFRGGPGQFRAWVFTVARRRATDEARRRARRPEQLVAELPEHDAGTAPDVAGEVVANLGTEAALRLIGRLPSDQAEIVLLRVVAGLGATEVAKLLGMSPGAVRVSAHRGLRRLAALLAPDEAVTP